jgi:UDP-GlcNAc:undecaprenyl-phosphate GlcNAc-1-phosphate transferase
MSIQTNGIFLSAFIILAMGVIDDLKELSVLAKLSIQLIATFLLIISGVRTHIVYIGSTANIIATVIWVLGVTNAFNLLDIMDGLAIIVAIIISFAFFIISLNNIDIRVTIMSLVLIGTGLSFLIQNFPPAKIYMGNTGSHFLGFILAVVALLISYASLERKIALLSPIIILWLPLLDTAFLVLARMKKKKIPFKKSNDHLALRFLALGYSKKKVLLVMLGLSLFFSSCGILLSCSSNQLGIIIVSSVIMVSLYFSYRMGKVIIED